jgi:ribosomal protein S18 acetylase RimI-like enzyme
MTTQSGFMDPNPAQTPPNRPGQAAPDLGLLDNPIWRALTSAHALLARSHGRAARYRREISPLAAVCEPSPEALGDLASLVEPGETIGFLSDAPPALDGDWRVMRTRPIDQMVCEAFTPAPAIPLLDLGPADAADMFALASATEPGPFLPGTVRMGRFCGLRAPDGRLMAMAGERMRMPGLVEVSAVCTDPAFRGRGYARALVSAMAARIVAEGAIPFLHVKTENRAKHVYEKLGFRVRRAIQYSVLERT